MANNKEKIDSLDQEDKYITLKEASLISRYAPDYIGQLIRAGKIEGKQVYSNVAWVTTESAIRAYMEGRGKSEDGRDNGENFIEEKAPAIARWALLGIIGVSAIFLVVLLYVLAVTIDHRLTETYIEGTQIDV